MFSMLCYYVQEAMLSVQQAMLCCTVLVNTHRLDDQSLPADFRVVYQRNYNMNIGPSGEHAKASQRCCHYSRNNKGQGQNM
jgi:hypothetical protein